MASKVTRISDAAEKTALTGTEKFPISDGSGDAKAVTANTIKQFVGSPFQSVSDDFDVSPDGELSLYSKMNIASFSGGSNNEIGSSVASVTLAWSMNKTPKTVLLDGTEIAVTETSKSVTGPWSSNKTFTLKAIDARGAESTKTTSISFLYRKYYGTSAKGTLGNADVLALSNKPLTAANGTATGSTEYDCTGGKYVWFCIPAEWPTPKFVVGGLVNSDFTAIDMNVTNASGNVTAYKLWRSNSIQTGKLTIVVQ